MSNEGLTTAYASELLVKYGLNELPFKKGKSLLEQLTSQFKNMLTVLLLIASLLSLIARDYLDAVLIFLIIILNGVLSFWQEFKASREIEALRKLEVLSVRVIRDGTQMEIPASKLVPGDVLLLESGDKVPADCTLIEVRDLSVNESSLTGESVPVLKSLSLKDNQVFFGTVVMAGRGMAIVTKTGSDTRFGKIALTLSHVPETPTFFEASIASIAKKIGILALIVSILVFILRLFQGHDRFEAFFTSIALMVAAVPEGLPTVITIALALGVRRMYRQKTLVRKMGAVEDLGAATVICTDKTGTLTKNEMRVSKVEPFTKDIDLLIKTAVLCNSASLVVKEDGGSFDILGDTTEGALLIWAKEQGVDPEAIRSEGKLIDEEPFNLKSRMMTTVWEIDRRRETFVKGAPEKILGLCKLTEKEMIKLTNIYEEMASQGLRVLGFAVNSAESDRLKFLGFIGIADAIRPEVKDAIRRAKMAGIKVIMITGDNELTAKHVAEEIGLITEGQEVITGVQLEQMDDVELMERLDKIRVFARVIPEHKLRIVKALQTKGEVVAVTGDGVNDSLALKQAEVGIAMGITGTDVAKEASDLIILDDNFATIIAAIEQGRLIYSNILKAVKFLLTTNFAELLVIVIATLLALPNPLLPVQILWINFVGDGLPALALVNDKASMRVMHTPPKKYANALDRNMLKFVIFYGGAMSVLVLTLYFGTLQLFGINAARSVAFNLLVIVQMGFVFMIRKNHGIFSNKPLFFSVALVLFMQLMISIHPDLRHIFKLS